MQTCSIKVGGKGMASLLAFAFSLGLASSAPAQTRTVGLFLNDSRAWPGDTLFSPKHNTMTYLIDNAGRVVHSWTKSIYEPGQSCVVTEAGHLMRACLTKGQMSTGGGEGGRLEEYDWDGNLVWQLDWSTPTYMQHHDFRLLPNGNVLLLVVEKKTVAEAVAAGFNPAKFQPEITTAGYLVPDSVVEIQPTRPVGGKVVWEWHVWDHLIQDFSSARANYGAVAAHPERVDPNAANNQIPAFWNHMNAIYYNAALDQIVLSVRGNSEIWVLDHSTTTAEAASSSGGRRGKGGDLLYRWGNPVMYRAGTSADQKLFQQHDAHWVDADCPGAGDFTAFNNGLGRNYSTIDEWTPPLEADGSYTRAAGSAWGPKDFTWTYKATPPASLYAEAISSAQRLPNGNTLICDGTAGRFLEVTSAGETVWKYVNPVVVTGPLAWTATIPPDPARPAEYANSVFRVIRYPVSYAGFAGRDLTPIGRVEIDPRPMAAFTYAPSSPKAGETVTFTDGSGNTPTSWSWSFGDGGTSTLKSPTHPFSAAGTFTVSLTASNSSGSDSASTTLSVASSSGGVSSVLFLPIVLDVTGRARYVSELSLANRGTTDATVTLAYTAASAFGGLGSGSATLSLPAGRQLVEADAIAFLRSKGLPIPSGNQGGSLRATFSNLSSEGAASALVRITAPSENGRAGVAYLAPRLEDLPTSATSWLHGLRSSSQDRTNVAFANASSSSSVTLRLTLVNGDGSGSRLVLPDVPLASGQWSQLDDVFTGTGFSQGYASVSVVSGSGPYFAYAVINDQVTNDGSFAPFELDPSPAEPRLLPVVVETGSYSSELVLTNRSSLPQSVQLSYVESLSPSAGAGASITESLAPGEQKLIPSALDELRLKATGIGPRGGSYAGTLSARFLSGSALAPGYAGARTGSPSRISSGRYGLFYSGLGTSSRALSSAWVFGLKQDSSVRSNVAAAASPENPASLSVQAQVYDGSTGKLAGSTAPVSLAPGGWTQWSNLLAAYGVSQGYVRVLNLSPSGSFTAYGVLNDGPSPASPSGTDDGSFVPGLPAGGN